MRFFALRTLAIRLICLRFFLRFFGVRFISAPLGIQFNRPVRNTIPPFWQAGGPDWDFPGKLAERPYPRLPGHFPNYFTFDETLPPQYR